MKTTLKKTWMLFTVLTCLSLILGTSSIQGNIDPTSKPEGGASTFLGQTTPDGTYTVYFVSWTTRDVFWLEDELPIWLLEHGMGRFFTHVATLVIPSHWRMQMRQGRVVIQDDSKKYDEAEVTDKTQEPWYFETHPFYEASAFKTFQRDLEYYVERAKKYPNSVVAEVVNVGKIPAEIVQEFYAKNIRYAPSGIGSKLAHKLKESGIEHPNRTVISYLRHMSDQDLGIVAFLKGILPKNKTLEFTSDEQEILENLAKNHKKNIQVLETEKAERTSFNMIYNNCVQKAVHHILDLFENTKQMWDDETSQKIAALGEFLNKRHIFPLFVVRKLAKVTNQHIDFSFVTDEKGHLQFVSNPEVTPMTPGIVGTVQTGFSHCAEGLCVRYSDINKEISNLTTWLGI